MKSIFSESGNNLNKNKNQLMKILIFISLFKCKAFSCPLFEKMINGKYC